MSYAPGGRYRPRASPRRRPARPAHPPQTARTPSSRTGTSRSHPFLQVAWRRMRATIGRTSAGCRRGSGSRRGERGAAASRRLRARLSSVLAFREPSTATERRFTTVESDAVQSDNRRVPLRQVPLGPAVPRVDVGEGQVVRDARLLELWCAHGVWREGERRVWWGRNRRPGCIDPGRTATVGLRLVKSTQRFIRKSGEVVASPPERCSVL